MPTINVDLMLTIAGGVVIGGLMLALLALVVYVFLLGLFRG
jgi:hypothetical protein